MTTDKRFQKGGRTHEKDHLHCFGCSAAAEPYCHVWHCSVCIKMTGAIIDCPCQSVEKAVNRQNGTYHKRASSRAGEAVVEGSTHPRRYKSPCCARHFDLQHNSDLTVPLYADRSELFVLPALSTSANWKESPPVVADHRSFLFTEYFR